MNHLIRQQAMIITSDHAADTGHDILRPAFFCLFRKIRIREHLPCQPDKVCFSFCKNLLCLLRCLNITGHENRNIHFCFHRLCKRYIDAKREESGLCICRRMRSPYDIKQINAFPFQGFGSLNRLLQCDPAFKILPGQLKA